MQKLVESNKTIEKRSEYRTTEQQQLYHALKDHTLMPDTSTRCTTVAHTHMIQFSNQQYLQHSPQLTTFGRPTKKYNT